MNSGLLWLLPLLPALGGGLLLIGGRRLDRLAGPCAILLALLACGLAGWVWSARPVTVLPWLGDWSLHLSGMDANAPLALLVAVMALLVLVYAQGFLAGHEARARFFGFMGLFLGAMLLLVLADDLLTLLIGWELVGMCSYALIGFWYHETERTQAALRAFVVTRTADLGLYLAALAAATGGTLLFAELADLPTVWRHWIAAGLVLAALGKSAQLPFTGWLSGAMQGPTPVSALLHSATMVAAGVVLLIKAQPLLQSVGWAGPLLVWLGVATALTAAVMALYQAELKQVLAASTVSQYGYLFAALGAGGVAGGVAHLVNHAAFKGLLFLCAGVLVAQQVKHFRQMGGLQRRLPWMAGLFAVGAWSLAALPPLGGFFSKEALLHAVDQQQPLAYWLLLAGGFLTAAYAARAWLATFAGMARSSEVLDVQPENWLMRLPLLLLALAVLLLAWVSVLALTWKALLAVLIALAGGVWMVRRYRREARLVVEPAWPLAERWFGLVDLLDGCGRGTLALARWLDRWERAWSLRRLVQWLVQRWPRWRWPTWDYAGRWTAGLAQQMALFDRYGLAVLMDYSGHLTRWLAAVSLAAERRGLDGTINALMHGLDRAAAGLSGLQSGQVYRYYLFLTVGIVALFGYALLQMW